MASCIAKYTGSADAPMCHVAVNVILALFVPPLAHYLARPGDVKSCSFIFVLVVWLAGIVLGGLSRALSLTLPIPIPGGGLGLGGLVALAST